MGINLYLWVGTGHCLVVWMTVPGLETCKDNSFRGCEGITSKAQVGLPGPGHRQGVLQPQLWGDSSSVEASGSSGHSSRDSGQLHPLRLVAASAKPTEVLRGKSCWGHPSLLDSYGEDIMARGFFLVPSCASLGDRMMQAKRLLCFSLCSPL